MIHFQNELMYVQLIPELKARYNFGMYSIFHTGLLPECPMNTYPESQIMLLVVNMAEY